MAKYVKTAIMEKKQLSLADHQGQEAGPQADATASMDPKLEYTPEILREGWLRAAAEADNLRKRRAAELGTARKEERVALLRAFLEVVGVAVLWPFILIRGLLR